MVIAVVIFVSGYQSYTHIKPTGSPLERALDLSCHAFLRWLRNACGGSRMLPATPPRPVDVRIALRPPLRPLLNALTDAPSMYLLRLYTAPLLLECMCQWNGEGTHARESIHAYPGPASHIVCMVEPQSVLAL